MIQDRWIHPIFHTKLRGGEFGSLQIHNSPTRWNLERTRRPRRRGWSYLIGPLGIRLPSTRIRCIQHTNPQLHESALQSGNFWINYESGIVWMLNPDMFFIRWRHQFEPCSLPWINNTVIQRNVISSFYFLDFSFKSHIMSTVKPSYDYSVHVKTAALQFEASFHVGRTNWTPKTS